MNKTLLHAFWGCGDNQIIDFAMLRARLNAREKAVLCMAMDDCLTQEQIAERLNISVRCTQDIWKSASRKLLSIEWVKCYALYLAETQKND